MERRPCGKEPVENEEVRSGKLQSYVGAYTQIDFSLPCPSIFDTSEEIKKKYGIRAVRPLAEKTMRRIARGLKKFVLDNPEPFIVDRKAYALIQYHSETAPDEVRGQGIKDPIMTVDGSNRYALVTSFLHKYFDGGYTGAGDRLENPLPTVTAWDHNSIVTANLIQMNNHCDGKDITEPLPTITAGDGHFGEVRAFLVKYYGGESTGQSVAEPLDTITTHDRFGLVTIQGVDYQIVDIGLRMLEPRELYGCQGFPTDYIIDHGYDGKKYSRSEQVKRCGNAVCPPIPAALVKSNLPELCVAERMPNMSIGEEQTGQLRFA